ncbi:unnamed protein product [Phytophthora fragariaefolia]|uniref:Unnamed protein product n=1 Tax=Phytophthora fragariaefolia TaxID=1490495 RepID=A0A9W7D8X0_9STRA|nr:unnamed protein product [Phytophthora fragariaefolia]
MSYQQLYEGLASNSYRNIVGCKKKTVYPVADRMKVEVDVNQPIRTAKSISPANQVSGFRIKFAQPDTHFNNITASTCLDTELHNLTAKCTFPTPHSIRRLLEHPLCQSLRPTISYQFLHGRACNAPCQPTCGPAGHRLRVRAKQDSSAFEQIAKPSRRLAAVGQVSREADSKAFAHDLVSTTTCSSSNVVQTVFGTFLTEHFVVQGLSLAGKAGNCVLVLKRQI